MTRSIEQKRSRRQEQKTAKEINGRTTPASGSRWHQKADVRSDKFLIECKTTTKDSYRLTAKTWEKIANEALRDNLKRPVMRVDLHDKYGDTYSYAIIPHEAYLIMRRYEIRKKNGGGFEREYFEDPRSSFVINLDDLGNHKIVFVFFFGTKGLEPDQQHAVVIMPWKEFMEHAGKI